MTTRIRRSFDDIKEEQRAADVEIIREFFGNVPEDHVLYLLSEELVESVLSGRAIREYGEF